MVCARRNCKPAMATGDAKLITINRPGLQRHGPPPLRILSNACEPPPMHAASLPSRALLLLGFLTLPDLGHELAAVSKRDARDLGVDLPCPQHDRRGPDAARDCARAWAGARRPTRALARIACFIVLLSRGVEPCER